MKTKTKFTKLFIALAGILAVCLCISLASVKTDAVPATAVTLTATDGTQTVLVDAVDTANYSWDPEAATLTLKSYTGRKISTNGDINLHLVGESTLTMDSDTPKNNLLYGIDLDGCGACATISADPEGTLNIVGTGLQTYFNAVGGSILMKNGTLNIDVDTSSEGQNYAIARNVSFDSECTDKAEININLEHTGLTKSTFFAFYNGAYFRERSNVEINVDIKGNSLDYICAFSDISIESSSPVIVVNTDNDGGDINNRNATDGMQAFSLTEGGYVEFNGVVRKGTMGSSINTHTVTTTPADNNYVWIEHDNNPYYSNDYVLSNLDGSICEKTVFRYVAEEATLKWVGGSHFNIPASKEEDRFSVNLLAGIRGLSTYDPNYIKIQVIEGQLPQGIILAYIGGAVNGAFSTPCNAGTVTFRLTDMNKTSNNSDDDRFLTFSISYGAVSEKDKYLTVYGEEPVDLKANGSGEGWSYLADTNTLTLNGYNGGPILTEGPITIHLKGTNTITLTNDKTTGIESTHPLGRIDLTADADGVLNINTPANYTKSFTGIKASLYVQNGTVNLDLSSDFSGDYTCEGVGVHGFVSFVEGTSDPAVWNLTMRNNATERNIKLFGNRNSSFNISNRTNVQVNIDIRGDKKTEIIGISSLYVLHSSADITVYADNDEGSADCYAVKYMDYLILTNGGSADFTGMVWVSSVPNTDPHTVTTTPLNNNYIWVDQNPNYYYENLIISDLEGNALKRVVFEYSDAPATLKWVGGDHYDIPAGSVGDWIGINFWHGIRGGGPLSVSSSHWKFEIIEGQLPFGSNYTFFYNGKADGQVYTPCVAGTFKVRATDMGGNSDPADDRSIEFEISYGAYITDTPVTGIELNKDSIILDHSGSGQFTATVTPSNAAYPNVNVMVGGSPVSVQVGAPVNGVSTVYLTSQSIVGKYILTVKTVELGLTDTITVYIREQTPNASIDYLNESLTGLLIGAKYRISGDGFDAVEFTADSTCYAIPDAWMGKTVSIVRVNDSEESCNSLPYELSIPQRPNAPTDLNKTDASASNESDGTITGLNSTMQYKKGSGEWTSVYTSSLTGLEIGTYTVRYKSTSVAFASKSASVTVGYGELSFADSDEYNIYTGETGSAVSGVNLSNAVSGGKKPYTFTIEGPAWLVISTNGMISGTRPGEIADATTATVTVTDAEGTVRTIVIAVGEVFLSHSHVYGSTWLHDGDYHWKQCDCGDKTEISVHTPDDDDDDCTTDILCTVCDGVATKGATAHTPEIDDGDCTTAIFCQYCSVATTDAHAGHTGGTATCEDKARCSRCNKEYGDLADHIPEADDNDCTTDRLCSVCGEVAIEGAADHVPNNDDGDCTTAITCQNCPTITTPANTSHTGGTATCESKAECAVCGKEYGSLAAHIPDADDNDCTTDRLCSICGEVVAEGANAHVPNNDDGDCTTAITCQNCPTITTPANTSHTGGTATCSERAECTVCGKEYGETLPHSPAEDDNDCTTARLCTVCGQTVIEAKSSHTGGTATCTEKAECAVCGKEYGDLASHSYGSSWITNANEHWNECYCGDKGNKSTHADGDNDQKCDTCGYEMIIEDDNDGLGTGATVAIALGSTAVVGLGGFSVFWFVIKQKNFAELTVAIKALAKNAGGACKKAAIKTGSACKKAGAKIGNACKNLINKIRRK